MLHFVDPASDWTSAIVVRCEQDVSYPRRVLAVVKPYSERRSGLISANNNTNQRPPALGAPDRFCRLCD